jgi:transcriptional regulator with XRE-family HTH domain
MRRIFMSKNYIERNTYSELLELDLQEVVSENIKRCVVESGYTAAQLSYRTNLSVATINRLKAGQNLSIRGICALADALNKDWRVFFA